MAPLWSAPPLRPADRSVVHSPRCCPELSCPPSPRLRSSAELFLHFRASVPGRDSFWKRRPAEIGNPQTAATCSPLQSSAARLHESERLLCVRHTLGLNPPHIMRTHSFGLVCIVSLFFFPEATYLFFQINFLTSATYHFNISNIISYCLLCDHHAGPRADDRGDLEAAKSATNQPAGVLHTLSG